VIIHGDCIEVMAGMDPESVDAIVTDPPYGLEFMGKEWDKIGRDGPASFENLGKAKFKRRDTRPGRKVMAEFDVGEGPYGNKPRFSTLTRKSMLAAQEWHGRWAEAAFRVAKPSAYLLAFGGTRTVHRMTVALEDAGWIIRDMLVWGYASGFPKSKASLKPAWEPIVMARKPGPLRDLAIDACRIPTDESWSYDADRNGTIFHVDRNGERTTRMSSAKAGKPIIDSNPSGRWPANIVLEDAIFEPGVPGVVIGQSLTGTMTAWWSSPDSEPSPTGSPVSSADRRSSRTAPGGSSRATATGPAGTQLDAWATSTDTPKPDTGCSDGTTADGRSTSGSTATSGNRRTARSPRDTLSTIATETGSTTGSTTSNSSHVASTPPSTSRSEPGSDEPSAYETLSDDSANWRRNSPSVEEVGYSRFFLIPKADRADREPVLGGLPEREGAGPVEGHRGRRMAGDVKVRPDGRVSAARANVHPTVKPTDLMRHLVRLVTPPGGTVLDPFLGSGTTGLAAEMEGFPWVGIEREAEYVAIAEARLNGTQRGLGLDVPAAIPKMPNTHPDLSKHQPKQRAPDENWSGHWAGTPADEETA